MIKKKKRKKEKKALYVLGCAFVIDKKVRLKTMYVLCFFPLDFIYSGLGKVAEWAQSLQFHILLKKQSVFICSVEKKRIIFYICATWSEQLIVLC